MFCYTFKSLIFYLNIARHTKYVISKNCNVYNNLIHYFIIIVISYYCYIKEDGDRQVELNKKRA